MRRLTNILTLLIYLSLLIPVTSIKAQTFTPDTLIIEEIDLELHKQFYDTLKYKASQRKLTRMIYDFLINPPRPYVDKKALALDYYSKMEGKVISSIEIKSLEVFGPSFEDTTKLAEKWIEKTANSIHTKSNLKTIKKLLLFKVGDFLDPEILYENERIIRALPYIKDLRFIIVPDSIYPGLVKISVITKDRFSLGVSGGVNGFKSGELELYNHNIFGVGHEVSLRFVGHLTRQPYMGLETYYNIKNIKGKFIDISAGYLNTYKNEGFSLIIDKRFITPSVKWAYGSNALRMYRTDRIFDDDPIRSDLPLDLSFVSAWAGRSFQIKPEQNNNAQIVLPAGFYNRTYYQRPLPEPSDNSYFSNSTFYLTGLTFTQRRFIQDQLVYSYGITEDIPEGFKNEIVYGFDANEFGDRHYAHLLLSNGNLLVNRKGYLYFSAAIGGYFKGLNYEQGQIEGTINFISKQVHAGRKRFRLFSRANYTVGIQRFDIEQLNLRKNNYIRGFSSKEAVGKQRLSLNMEYVLFLRKEFYNFNMAIYGFGDVGIIGSNKNLILGENYYSGLGFGVRLHNENLVFRTFHLRLSFYPFHPKDMGFFGFILDEQLRQKFYSFQPIAPQPLRFE